MSEGKKDRENKVKDSNYINIQGWMLTKLKLSGNNLLCYAIIYGFSQDDNNVFNGSLQYLADWCNSTKRGIQKNLSNLVQKGYIYKEEHYDEKKVKYCTYYTKPLDDLPEMGGIEQSSMVYRTKFHRGIEQSSTNNILDKLEDKLDTDISNDISADESANIEINSNNTPFSNLNNMLVQIKNEDKKEESKKKRRNQFEQFMDIIDNFTDDDNLRELLKAHARMWLSLKKDKKGKPLVANRYIGAINELARLSDDVEMQCRIVGKSVKEEWLYFYPYKDDNGQQDLSRRGIQMQKSDAKAFKDGAEAKEYTENLQKEYMNSGRRAVF